MNPFRNRILHIVMFVGFRSILLFSQSDSVDVTFYYQTVGYPTKVYLAGEFNKWANNQDGQISDPSAAMTFDAQTGQWTKTVRLRVGGPVPLPDPGRSIPGAYQYKFNENGSVNGWKPDPLNPRQNAKDNNNSLVFVRNPTLLYLLPNSFSGLVKSQKPEISVYIFPSVSSVVDTQSVSVRLDEKDYVLVGSGYDPVSRRFRFTPNSPLRNGRHLLKIRAQCTGFDAVSDSTEFMVQAGAVILLTRPDSRYLHSEKTIDGVVEDKQIKQALLLRETDSTVVSVSNGIFSKSIRLEEGENRIWAAITDSSGHRRVSDTIQVHYWIDHRPRPIITLSQDGGVVRLAARGNDPDGDAVQFFWRSDDSWNPSKLALSKNDSVLTVPIPPVPGEYYFDLDAKDPDGNEGNARTFFTVRSGGSLVLSGVNSNPDWVRDAVVYEIYLPAFTDEGTLAAAEEKLPHIRELGANVVWLMPVYENGESVNEINAGYNITDFYKIHPQFGTMDDLQHFIDAAHKLGIRVILDSTPNHVSEKHPWVQEIELYRDYANSRPIIENRILGDNRGMGQSASQKDGYTVSVRYDGWGLANLNYASAETRLEMTEMYEWWLREQSVDGFRMDVYWGPQNRYGSAAWWRPFREEIKRVRPEAFILGETDGTGTGSERNYADGGGSCDAAYDWNFFNQVKSALSGGSIDDLDARVRNYSTNTRYNHYTGKNAHYFRFLENHDETRITGLFSIQKTKAAAVLLASAPGIPMVYAGQEAGETSQRGKIQWTREGAAELGEWYVKLFRIRNRFQAFRSDEIVRIRTDQTRVYAFLRPDSDQCAITAINFSNVPSETRLVLGQPVLRVGGDTLADGRSYFMNDVLNDTSYQVEKSQLKAFPVTIDPFNAVIFILADKRISSIVGINSSFTAAPGMFELQQNFPNPFNAGTKISFRISNGVEDSISLIVYDLLGKTVRILLKKVSPKDIQTIEWDGNDAKGNSISSGIYICRLEAGPEYRNIKMACLR